MPSRGGLNVWTARRFRELVALVLEVEGFEGATPRTDPRRMSDAFADDMPATDVLGIEGVTIHCRADTQPAWSSALDAVERAAQLDGSDHALLVEMRRGRNGSESYAVMSLDGWARLARLALAKETAS